MRFASPRTTIGYPFDNTVEGVTFAAHEAVYGLVISVTNHSSQTPPANPPNNSLFPSTTALTQA